MNVLWHGIPFFCDATPLERYAGTHDIRAAGIGEDAQYRYDPVQTDCVGLIDQISQAWRPDLLVCWMPEVHPPPLDVEDCPITTAAIVSDWNVFHDALAVNLARYDVVFCDKFGVQALASDLVQPRYAFPLYSQVSTVHRPRAVPKEIDVCFLGSLNHRGHRERGRYLERLARLSGRYSIVIGTQVYGDAYGELLSRSRLVFNHSIRGELNLRTFETMACGAVPLLEESNLEVRDYFTDDVDIVLYNGENFEDRICRYLENPEAAEAVAQRAQSRAAEFAGENRFTQVVDVIAEALKAPSGRPFRTLPPEERDYQSLLMYGFSRFQAYRPMQDVLLKRLLASTPRDPRVWTAVGRAGIVPPEDGAGARDCLKAFIQAHRLAPGSAPYALNVASMARMYRQGAIEAEHLERTLQAENLEGAGLLVGNPLTEFMSRANRASAEHTLALDVLHSEAASRLAALCAANGDTIQAEALLQHAAGRDPESTGGIRLLAEILWNTERKEEAISLLQRRLGDVPFDFDYRARLGQMLRETGNCPAAEALAADTALLKQPLFNTGEN